MGGGVGGESLEMSHVVMHRLCAQKPGVQVQSLRTVSPDKESEHPVSKTGQEAAEKSRRQRRSAHHVMCISKLN